MLSGDQCGDHSHISDETPPAEDRHVTKRSLCPFVYRHYGFLPRRTWRVRPPTRCHDAIGLSPVRPAG
jgi:hypothetical protein